MNAKHILIKYNKDNIFFNIPTDYYGFIKEV